jgi:CRP-like cAMP-binding protein
MDQKLELLRRVPLFAALGGRELEEVGRLADEVELPAGRVLTHEGRSADEFFVIVDGSVRIERGGVTVSQLGDGDFLGEIALIDGGPRTATATAERDGRFLVVGHREFHSLLEQFPTIQLAVLEAVARRVRALDPDSCA